MSWPVEPTPVAEEIGYYYFEVFKIVHTAIRKE